MKRFVLSFALIIGLLTSATTAMAQVNMSRYITLTVTNGAAIELNFKAAAAGTPVRIVSGSNTQDITVGTSWTGFSSYTADGTTMTVYGDLTGFDCQQNKVNLTALDVSHNTQLEILGCNNNILTALDLSKNTQLKFLYCYNNKLSSLNLSKNTKLHMLICYGNNLSTQALDDIYCALPDRTGNTNGKIQPVYNSSSSNLATVLATNAANATAKNWKVQYYDDNTDIPATTGSYTCPQLNMSRYITLTVTNGAAIKLDFKTSAAATPVRIVSGSNTQDVTVGTGWYDGHTPSSFTVTAGSTTMTVYGDIIMFDCSKNGANLTAIDLSHNTQLTVLNCRNNSLNSLDISQNTQLETLYCHGNNLSTQALDDIFCALPDRTGKTNGKILPIYNSSSSNHATVIATNAANATAKNWKVQYYENKTDIPATTGSYVCGSSPQPNMDSYITLTVVKDSAIRLDFWAAATNTPVRIVSGSNTQDVTVGTGWTGYRNYTAGSTTMTIYGDITRFDCSGNGANLTAIDPSHNTQLTELWCQNNTLNSLDVSGCTQLTKLSCQNNNLTTLDVSKNTQLTKLSCRNNNLTTLDVSKNTKLTTLYCHGNNLSTQALDDIYCALPDRTGNTNGVIQPVYNSSSSNHATVLATNAANATAKNWKVQYYDDNTDIPTTTGTYVCGTPHTDIAEASAEPALTLYPNPVADVLYLSATARTIRVYDIYGTEVAHAYDTDKVEVSHLPAGIYTVKADGTVAKMVKR